MMIELDPQLDDLLIKVGTKSTRHTPTTFLYDHLVETWRLLKFFECSEDVCNAGLFHSIYGTQVFKPSMIPIKNRYDVQELIGKEAENLVFLFHITPHVRFDHFVMMSEPIRSHLITIEYANMMEQKSNWDNPKFHPYLPWTNIQN